MAGLYRTPPQFRQAPTFIREDIPVYRLREDIYTSDTLFLKGSTIEADDDYEPNIAMFPINEMALVKYRNMLAARDKLGALWHKIPLKERQGYLQELPRLPAFEREWEKVNNLAKTKGIHICYAVDQSPSILGAVPTGAPKVRSVDMSSIATIPYADNTAIGKGNTADKEMSAPAAVRASTAA
jgi:hypothetical protein